MEGKLRKIQKEATSDLKKTFNTNDLESFEKKYLHKKYGLLTGLLKDLPKIPPGQRKIFGQQLNALKLQLLKDLEIKKTELATSRYLKIYETEWIDVTAPGKRPLLGHRHLVTQAIREISRIFENLGFVRRRYREVETDYYAFESLNMPKDHVARDEWETFYITDNIVLTPHTSSGQVREMELKQLPIRFINISRCDRRQADITHLPTFYQFEGLLVDTNVSIAHLKGVFDYFVKNYFGPERKIRLRPTDFRFTEPSFEVDVSCGICLGKGCKTCKSGWLELAGAGMVHPNVLKAGGLDREKVTGFAFGWGVERSFMMKSEEIKLDDIRIIYKNDLRFLEQF